MAETNLATLALAQLFHLAVDEGKPILKAEVLGGIRQMLDDRLDNVVKNDQRDGWTNTHVSDPHNDYPGTPREKRIDNMFFLYGKALPGKLTDKIRDILSERDTPALSAKLGPDPSGQEIAVAVGDAIYAEAEDIAGKV